MFFDRVRESWRRQDGHRLAPDDLREVVAEKPDALIVGTGFSGVVKVPPGTLEYLESNGIEVHVHKSPEAVKLYNSRSKNHRTVLALHLTC